MIRWMLLAAAVGAAADGTTKVEVDGAKYRVTVKAGAVTVARKALAVTWNMEERERQRRAVQAATGCSVVDELAPEDARLRGRLECRP